MLKDSTLITIFKHPSLQRLPNVTVDYGTREVRETGNEFILGYPLSDILQISAML